MANLLIIGEFGNSRDLEANFYPGLKLD